MNNRMQSDKGPTSDSAKPSRCTLCYVGNRLGFVLLLFLIVHIIGFNVQVDTLVERGGNVTSYFRGLASRLIDSTSHSSTWTNASIANINYTNFMSHEGPRFLKNYKNPCWYVYSGGATQLRCLPYAYILGVEKCGTTELYDKLTMHPKVRRATLKEPIWWDQKRFGARTMDGKPASASQYLDNFADATKSIGSHCANMSYRRMGVNPSECYHDIITVDASASTLWFNPFWSLLPENVASTGEPTHLTPHYIKHIQPQAKLIVMLRNPIEREFSDFYYLNYKNRSKTPQDFHKKYEPSIKLINECFRKHSLRRCVYNNTLFKQLKTLTGYKGRMLASLYFVYIQEWLKVFPREQLLVLRTNDLKRNRISQLKKVFNFLKLEHPPEGYYRRIRRSRRSNVTFSKLKAKMLTKTKTLLKEFFGPFNALLSQLLGDEKWLWDDSLTTKIVSKAKKH